MKKQKKSNLAWPSAVKMLSWTKVSRGWLVVPTKHWHGPIVGEARTQYCEDSEPQSLL